MTSLTGMSSLWPLKIVGINFATYVLFQLYKYIVMKFDQPLVHGVLIKRYKRFLADIQLDDGSLVVAHCTNSVN